MSYWLETVVSWAKRRGFVYPGSDVYGGLANAWDYGPYGSQLKKNILDLRWKQFVQTREDMIGLDSQILMHPKVWEASGHVAGFNDPLVDDKNTGKRYRADKLIEDNLFQLEKQIIKDIFKAEGIDPKDADTDEVLNLDHRVQKELIDMISNKIGANNLIPESWTFEQMREYLVQFEVIPPDAPKKYKAERTEVRKFNMMFYTYQGAVHDEDAKVWLRPETAQGIFVNFKNVMDTTRIRVPFGMAQVGKAFRNEITPGNFLYRTREFEQIEIEYFVPADEDEAMEHFRQWQDDSLSRWQDTLKLNPKKLRFREHEQDELAHYSKGTFDVEYEYPRGWGELQGIAYRTDFDLLAHQTHSGKDFQYTDPQTGQRYIPHVIEPSFGLSRMVLTVLLDCYDEEEYTDGKGETQTRVVARFPASIAPIQVAILPLMKKDEGMIQIARDLQKDLQNDYFVDYDEGGAIGKRYRRQDEIGTPYCITIDHDTLEDGTVTIRYRDTMQQERIKITDLRQKLSQS